MDTASLFMNGRSQAVRLPMGYRFSGNRVCIKRVGKAVVLFPHDEPWETLLDAPDFMDERSQPSLQEREAL